MRRGRGNVVWLVLLCLGGAALIVILMFALPMWNVWRAGLTGEAALRRAEHEKRITIETAKAELESAKIRAEAIEALGAMAKQYPEYRYQEFLGAFSEALQDGTIRQIVYVPTEAMIPITEAGRAVSGK